ncbi:MAG: hypothetical protein HY518_03865 [Candidatus Aenigmarchaeota archaeon]|nr:hypothetical protein [Candidatus Aenigmarchaeota archaeon]
MNIVELYEKRDAVLGAAFSSLQTQDMMLTPLLDSPEVMGDALLNEFLARNYLFATDFKADGSAMMGR